MNEAMLSGAAIKRAAKRIAKGAAKRTLMAASFVIAATAAAWTPNGTPLYDRSDSQSYGARVIFANAPGGDYNQCDPRNPSSPVRCKPDGW